MLFSRIHLHSIKPRPLPLEKEGNVNATGRMTPDRLSTT